MEGLTFLSRHSKGGFAFLMMFVRAIYAEGAPSLRFLQGRVPMLPTQLFVRSPQTPLRMRSCYPPFAKNAKDGAPHRVGDASEIKTLGHPPSF